MDVKNAQLAVDNIWLECTSQITPFNYIANFTDDRDVFGLTHEGGKIIHAYKRTQILNKGSYNIDEYNDFRDFMSTIVRYDKSKMVLISKT
jgi:hypothetical protein